MTVFHSSKDLYDLSLISLRTKIKEAIDKRASEGNTDIGVWGNVWDLDNKQFLIAMKELEDLGYVVKKPSGPLSYDIFNVSWEKE